MLLQESFICHLQNIFIGIKRTQINLSRGIENKRSGLINGSLATLFESENERQKIEPVPIPLSRASRNFPDVKTRNDIFFHNWTSEIIPFIRFGMKMDRT